MKLLIVPIYSMRSHDTGMYNLLLDSNMNIALHKCSVLSSDYVVHITIPRNANQVAEVQDIVRYFDCEVTFLPIKYGKHAGETRDILNESVKGIHFKYYDKVELGVASIDPIIKNTEYHLYNTSILGTSRPYADKHFPALLKRLNAGYRVNFSCTNQLYKIPKHQLHLCSTDMKLFSKQFNSYMMQKFVDEDLYQILSAAVDYGAYFFPFRLSDPCYKWEYISQVDKQIIITDPNDSGLANENTFNIGELHGCKKTLYCTMLALMRDRKDITIPLYEDIALNYHISIVEMVDQVFDSIDLHVQFNEIKFISRYMR